MKKLLLSTLLVASSFGLFACSSSDSDVDATKYFIFVGDTKSGDAQVVVDQAATNNIPVKMTGFKTTEKGLMTITLKDAKKDLVSDMKISVNSKTSTAVTSGTAIDLIALGELKAAGSYDATLTFKDKDSATATTKTERTVTFKITVTA